LPSPPPKGKDPSGAAGAPPQSRASLSMAGRRPRVSSQKSPPLCRKGKRQGQARSKVWCTPSPVGCRPWMPTRATAVESWCSEERQQREGKLHHAAVGSLHRRRRAGGVPAAGAWPTPEPPRAGQSICERVGKWGLGFPRRPVWVVLTQRRTRWTVRFIPTVSSDRCRQKQALGCNEPGHRVSSTIYPPHRALCKKKALGCISFGPVIFYRNSFNCFLLSF
jgi:hypothetical protein